MEIAVLRTIDVLMEPAVRAVCRDVRFQTGSGLQPVVDVVAGQTVALLVKMVCIITNIVL